MNIEKKIIVAIDGFSSCGKSTMAKDLAAKTGYVYIDSGAMYRAISLFCIREGLINAGVIDELSLKKRLNDISIRFEPNEKGEMNTFLNGENVEKYIRTLEVSNAASRVSAIGFVRAKLVEYQQKLGSEKGVVMDGRDIGTVVFPNAELKIFVTASAEIRAERRYKELLQKGEKVCLEDVLANVKERDERDQNRTESPLRQAEDAIVLDNSYMTQEEQMEWLLSRFYETIQI